MLLSTSIYDLQHHIALAHSTNTWTELNFLQGYLLHYCNKDPHELPLRATAGAVSEEWRYLSVFRVRLWLHINQQLSVFWCCHGQRLFIVV